MLDLETLRLIWWLLLGVLIIGFAIMDGFDLGIATIYHIVARTNSERRIVLNTIGPIWESNQVWFILVGGASFAAWPLLYAVSFSGMYFAMFIILTAFILRPVSIKFRSKIDNPKWHYTWDLIFSLSGFIPALLFGVAIGNVMQGLPFNFDSDLRMEYAGTFFELLNPFAILCGLISLTMLIMHGCQFLALKTRGDILNRANSLSKYSSLLVVILFCVAGYCTNKFINGYVITSYINHSGPSNPLYKEVVTAPSAWIHNFYLHRWMWLGPILGVIGPLKVFILSFTRYYKLRFIASSASLIGIISTFGLSIFPFILPSSTQLNSSLTVWDASSSQLTLFTMLLATIILLPIVLFYTSWVYAVLKGPVTTQDLEKKSNVNSY